MPQLHTKVLCASNGNNGGEGGGRHERSNFPPSASLNPPRYSPHVFLLHSTAAGLNFLRLLPGRRLYPATNCAYGKHASPKKDKV